MWVYGSICSRFQLNNGQKFNIARLFLNMHGCMCSGYSRISGFGDLIWVIFEIDGNPLRRYFRVWEGGIGLLVGGDGLNLLTFFNDQDLTFFRLAPSALANVFKVFCVVSVVSSQYCNAHYFSLLIIFLSIVYCLLYGTI